MKSIKYSYILFFCLAWGNSIFTMSQEQKDIGINKVYGGISCGLMAIDLFSGSKGSYIRATGTVIALLGSYQLDKLIGEDIGLKNCDILQTVSMCGITTIYTAQTVTLLGQYLDRDRLAKDNANRKQTNK